MTAPEQATAKCPVCKHRVIVLDTAAGTRLAEHYKEPGNQCTGSLRPVPPPQQGEPVQAASTPGFGYQEIGPIDMNAKPYRQRDEPGHPHHVAEPKPLTDRERVLAEVQRQQQAAALQASGGDDVDSLGSFVRRQEASEQAARPEQTSAPVIDPRVMSVRQSGPPPELAPVDLTAQLYQACTLWAEAIWASRQSVLELVATTLHEQTGGILDEGSRYAVATGVVDALIRAGVLRPTS